MQRTSSNQAKAETLFPPFANVRRGLAKLCHDHHLNYCTMSHLPRRFAKCPRVKIYSLCSLALRERERVHNNKLFGSLLPGAIQSPIISLFPPLYALHSVADEIIIISTHVLKGSFALPSSTPH